MFQAFLIVNKADEKWQKSLPSRRSHCSGETIKKKEEEERNEIVCWKVRCGGGCGDGISLLPCWRDVL